MASRIASASLRDGGSSTVGLLLAKGADIQLGWQEQVAHGGVALVPGRHEAAHLQQLRALCLSSR